ncbi:MAG: MFS transporter [Planctomycetota bacterium]|jgi:MFS family permease
MTQLPASTFRLVLLVSCAHALVHTFELALPAVEQMIAADFPGVGKEQTGELGLLWRLPFGLGAILAGWLADRYGFKPLLIVYLLGCSATACLTWWAPTFGILSGVMFSMGCFASIYHPAGLALIARESTPENRGTALGWHGILGSMGIAGAPFCASLVFQSSNVSWRDYYLLLTVPALIIATLLGISVRRQRKREAEQPSAPQPESVEERIPWKQFLILVFSGAMSGFVYAAFMHFLPRYMDGAQLKPDGWTDESFRNTLATAVLLCAAVGQAIAGRLCRPGRLETLLVLVLAGNVPPLLWMSVAEGPQRFVAACLLALVHFMNQPIYNSLIAQVIPASCRSTGYGFSNMMCFGIGALGPFFAGRIESDGGVYALLAGFATIAAVCALGVKATRPTDATGH